MEPVSKGVVWELNGVQMPSSLQKDGKIQGVLVLDVDGTLTRPGYAYLVDQGAISAVGDFLLRGGHVIFCTGATAGRVEDTVLTPLFTYVEGHPNARVDNVRSSILLIPENGSALLSLWDVAITENSMKFVWHRMHEKNVPQKEELRKLLEEKVVPLYPNSKIWSDRPSDPIPRDYIVSLKGLPKGTPPQVIERIKSMRSEFPGINWDLIRMVAARTTVDFIHLESGKTAALRWLLSECSGLVNMTGPILGVGDLGDAFAEVIPTFNVNRHGPNEFRKRKMPALDFCGPWRLLRSTEYMSTKQQGKDQKIISQEDGQEIPVLRDEQGCIIFAVEKRHPATGKKVMRVAGTGEKGYPVEISFLIPDPGRRFELLKNDSFTITRRSRRLVVRDVNPPHRELNVLRDSDGEILHADRISRTTGFPHICDKNRGTPIEVFKDGYFRQASYDVQDAGQSTAWLIRRLMDIGYFALPTST